MKKIHITLIGGQKMPVYKGIIASAPEYTYLVHTSGSRRDAEFIESMLDHPAERIEVDEFDMAAIIQKVKEKVTQQGEITVNVTAALKTMSFALYKLFEQDPNATIFYMDQSDRYINLKNLEKKDMQIPISLMDICTLMNHRILDVLPWGEVDEDLKRASLQIRKLATQFPNAFYKMAADLRDFKDGMKAHQNIIKAGESSLLYDHMKKRLVIKMNKHRKQDLLEIDHPRAYELIGRTLWLEIEAAHMLSTMPNLDELLIGLIFAYSTNPNNQSLAKNELDLILRINNRIVVIEVKTSIFDIKDIDKFKAGVRTYFGDSATPIFLTDAPIRINQKEKLDDAGVAHICLSELRDRHPNDTHIALQHAIYQSMVANHTR